MNQQRNRRNFSSKAKWEAGRQKPSVLNLSRRRKDFRDTVELLKQNSSARPISSKGGAIVETRDGKNLIVDKGKRIVIKSKMMDFNALQDLLGFLKEKKFSKVKLVFIKSSLLKPNGTGWVQHYFKRPSLHTLERFFRGPHNRLLLDSADLEYCESLVKANQKITARMVDDAFIQLENAFYAWRPKDGFLRWNFGDGVNVIVFGLSKDGKLKVGFVDV